MSEALMWACGLYAASLLAIALAYPNIGKPVAGMGVWLSLGLVLALFGAFGGLLVAKRYISDPANQGHFWGPNVSDTLEGSIGFRQVVFADEALTPELWQVATWMGWALTFLAISLGIQVLCAAIDNDKMKKRPGRKRRDTGTGQDDPPFVPDHPGS